MDCRFKRAAKMRSQNAKELNALVQSEVRKALSKAESSKNQVKIPLIVNPVLALWSDVNY